MVEGISAVVAAVDSGEDGFTVDVEVAGSSPTFGTVGVPLVDTWPIWWASDDRGNAYLGGMISWHGGDDRIEGQLEFWPALDP